MMQETGKPKKTRNIFRQEALNQFSSPEQLDQLVEVINPRSWIPLATIGGLLLAAGVWSVFGRLPLTVSGQAILLQPRRVVQFQSPSSGQLLTLTIQPGDKVRQGQVLGTIDQSQLQEQLRQQQNKLAELLSQTRQRGTLQQRQSILQRQILQQQRQILERTLQDTRALTPVVREKGLVAIQQNRKGLMLRLEQMRSQLPILQQRVERRRELSIQGAISQDAFLQVQQEYFDRVSQVAELESQLQQLQLKELETQQQYLQNQSSIKQAETQLQDLSTQETKLIQQTTEQTFTDQNQLDEVRRQIAQLQLQLSTQGKIISPYNGRVLEVSISSGQMVQAGGLLGSIQAENPTESLSGLAFFSDSDGKQIRPGMTAQVTPSVVKRERYGSIVGKVTNVTPYPVTSDNIRAIVGNPDLAKQLTGPTAPVQAMIQLMTDKDTFSGYEWTSSRGPQQTISSGTSASVQVRIGEIAPIAYVIPLFRSWTGIY